MENFKFTYGDVSIEVSNNNTQKKSVKSTETRMSDWERLDKALTAKNGFMRSYFALHAMIGNYVTVHNRDYKITSYDVLVLEYLIDYQKNSIRKVPTDTKIAETLNISVNTLGDTLKKMRTLKIITAKTINNTYIRLYVDYDVLIKYCLH
jgi:hypothetical protein